MFYSSAHAHGQKFITKIDSSNIDDSETGSPNFQPISKNREAKSWRYKKWNSRNILFPTSKLVRGYINIYKLNAIFKIGGQQSTFSVIWASKLTKMANFWFILSIMYYSTLFFHKSK